LSSKNQAVIIGRCFYQVYALVQYPTVEKEVGKYRTDEDTRMDLVGTARLGPRISMKFEVNRRAAGACGFDSFRPKLSYNRVKCFDVGIWEVKEAGVVTRVKGETRKLRSKRCE
jgi:hypothetical protein